MLLYYSVFPRRQHCIADYFRDELYFNIVYHFNIAKYGNLDEGLQSLGAFQVSLCCCLNL